MTLPGFMRFFVVVLAALAIFGIGGKADGVLVAVQAGVALALGLSAVLMPSVARLRPGWDLVLLVLPICALTVVQLLWPQAHPMLGGDTVGAAGWTLDAVSTEQRLRWLVTVAGFLILVHVWWRGTRASRLLRVLAGLAAVHAGIALIIGPSVPDWPAESAYRARIRGTFVYPNQAAVYWASALPLALWMAIRQRCGHWWVAAGVLLIALVLSASRGGIIAAAVVVIPYLFYLLPRGRRWLIAPLVLLGVVTWLAMLGLDPVIERFERLDSQAETLNGRVTIWSAALSQVDDLGAFGAGAGNADLAYLRSGSTAFEPARVEHMHSDPVELLIDYGWLGALLVVAAWLWLLARRWPHFRALRGIRRAALVGLVVMAIHGLADHLQESEAINLVAVAMLVAVLQHRRKEQAVRSTWAFRLVAGLLAVGLLWQLPASYRVTQERALASQASAWLRKRVDKPLQYGRLAETLRDLEQPITADAAVAAMRWWNTRGEQEQLPEAAERALAVYGQVIAHAPGSVRLHLEAARAHRLRRDFAAMWRELHWVRQAAPGWRHGQLTMLYCGLESPDDVAGDPHLTRLIEDMLQMQVQWPDWFSAAAVAVLGKERLLEVLPAAAPGPLIACRPWLARHGPLALWLKAWEVDRGRRQLDIRQWPLREHLSETLYVRFDTSDYLDQVRKAQACFKAGMPLPPDLVAYLEAREEPVPHWAEPLQLGDAEWRERNRARLTVWLHVPVAHERWHFLTHAIEVFNDPRRLLVDDDPRLVATLLADEQAIKDDAWVDGVLARWRHPVWQTGGWGRAMWLWIDDQTARWLRQETEFVGVMVDGVWKGWHRGLLDLTALCGDEHGMHSVLLLNHPDRRN